MLAPAHPRDFSIRLSWTGDIRVKLRVSCYRDQARKQLVGHRFVQLQDGLNRFGVYSRDQTLYMYPALSITGKGTLTIESFAVGTWDGAPSSAPTTSD